MKEEYRQWHSPHLNQECSMLVFGHAGMPLVLFPTSQGRYYQNKDMGMLEAVRGFVDEGRIKVYCPDSIDNLSWYNQAIPPAARAYNQTCYDRMVLEEIALPAQEETGVRRVATAGPSFGGYHAVNFAFRHPETVSYVFSMSGVNRALSKILGEKNISHWLDIRAHAVHDWPLWREMFPQYVSLLLPSY
jgi:esterase/lipase superfamily enzyme